MFFSGVYKIPFYLNRLGKVGYQSLYAYMEFGNMEDWLNMCCNKAVYLAMSGDEMRDMLGVNVVALTYLTKLSVNSMKERNVGLGHIININR